MPARARSSANPTTWVALLRGVNVGGRKLPMADLRRLCEEAGATDVQTYIQSGNVVFRHAAKEAALVADLEERIAAHAGFAVPVVLRSATELRSVVARCPFPTDGDPTKLVVQLVQAKPGAGALGALDPDGYGEERLALDGRELYLWLPFGQGRSELVKDVGRTPFGKVATARNWRTMLTLLDLAS